MRSNKRVVAEQLNPTSTTHPSDVGIFNQLRLAISASNTDMNNVFINGSAYSPPSL